MGDLEKFVDFLFEKNLGYVYSPVKRKEEWDQRFFAWPSERDNLISWIRTSALEGDVYLGPALFKTKVAKKSEVKSSNVVWVEFDGKREIDFGSLPSPDVIVQSSSDTHQHCYWKTEPHNLDSLEEVNRRLTYFLEADSSGWDATQVLRPPETMNYKRSLPVSLIKFAPPIFKHAHHNFDKAPAVERPVGTITYDDVLAPELVLPRYKLGMDLIKRVTTEIAVEPNRSQFLMSTGYYLAESGLEHVDIVSLLYLVDCRIKKFVGRSDQLVRLNEIASIARAKVEKEHHVAVYSPLDIINNELDLDFIVPGWLHTKGILIVTGMPGVGKTQFCLDLAYHLTTGTKFLEKELSPSRVGFLSLEMDTLELKYILNLQGRAYTQQDVWAENLFIVAPDLEAGFLQFEELIKKQKPQVLIIDSLSEMATDDLKESEARRIMRWVRKVVRQFDTAVILIHHNRKATDGNKKPNKLSDLYGSYIFGKLTETVISLWEPDGVNYLELDTLKARFGERKSLVIKRTETLTFEITEKPPKEEDVSRKPGSGKGASNPLITGINLSIN